MGLTDTSMAYRGRQRGRHGAGEMDCSWPAYCKLLAVNAQVSQILAPPTGAGSDVRRGRLQLLASLWLSLNRCQQDALGRAVGQAMSYEPGQGWSGGLNVTAHSCAAAGKTLAVEAWW